MSKNDYCPEGYHAVTPSLAIKGATAAIEWYKNVFGAKEKMRMENPDKTIGHAELVIGDSMIMLAEENPQYNKSPKTTNGNSISLYVYVSDVDATIKKAQDDRAKVIRPAEDMFYGDRVGHIEDPFGYDWNIATHVKDVSEEEMRKGMEAMAHEHA
ncbi:MAG TPA: VOC family protein [Chitinophagaceae bacterium]|nr:VOC family protein [Chitinophagaceae bacterium]